MDNLLLKLDETVTNIVGQWDVYTTAIAVAVITVIVYQVFTSRDPDAHPMLLARQSSAAPVRKEGESAVFRAHTAPHGIPLNSGLGVKDPEDSKWARGRDGDLRDVWRRVVSGSVDKDGRETGVKGEIMTIMGREQVTVHDLGTALLFFAPV
jgi:hypothetical protein